MEKINTSFDKKFFYGFRKVFIKNYTIPAYARFLLILLFTFKGKNTNCWPSIGTLSKCLGLNKDTTRKYLKVLEKEGYLKIESRGIGRSNRYTPSYCKFSSGSQSQKTEIIKPAEETIRQPSDSTLNRSINSENKVSTFKTGKELFDQRRRELGLL